MDKETQKNLSDDFVKLLRFTGRDGIEDLIRYLQEETDFFTAPASTKYHLRLCAPPDRAGTQTPCMGAAGDPAVQRVCVP